MSGLLLYHYCTCGCRDEHETCPTLVPRKQIGRCLSLALPRIISEIVLSYAQQTMPEKIIAWIDHLPNATFAVPQYIPGFGFDFDTHIILITHDQESVCIKPSWSSSAMHMHVLLLVHAAMRNGHIKNFTDCACRDDVRWMVEMIHKCTLNALFMNFPGDSHFLSLALAHALDEW